MAQCVTIDSAASDVLRASTADPCTTLVVLTPAEYATLSLSPWTLTPEDGALLSAAILSVWAVAWSIRALAKALNVDGEPQED